MVFERESKQGINGTKKTVSGFLRRKEKWDRDEKLYDKFKDMWIKFCTHVFSKMRHL